MGKPCVLLAEDDFYFGSILKQYLEIHNFEVRWAHDGQEALEIFKEHTSLFDIRVFDVMMPKMDGFMLAEKVISIDPEIPFVFLKAKKMKDDRVKGLKLGVDDYIIKPFEADRMRDQEERNADRIKSEAERLTREANRLKDNVHRSGGVSEVVNTLLKDKKVLLELNGNSLLKNGVHLSANQTRLVNELLLIENIIAFPGKTLRIKNEDNYSLGYSMNKGKTHLGTWVMND